MFKLDLEKAKEPESKLPTSTRSSKKQEFQKNIYFCFIDYTKTFECVDQNKLWKILKEMEIPDHLTCLLRNLYAGQEATVRTGHGKTDWFQIGKGVRHGSILSPCLFNLYAGTSASLVAQTVKRLPIMQETRVQSLSREDPLEKEMATHSSILAWKIPGTEDPGRLQSMWSQIVRHNWAISLHFTSEYIMRKARLDEAQAGIKITGGNVNNLRYADDTTLMAETEEGLKNLLMKVKEGSEKFGLKLNIQKTKVMTSGPITSWQIDEKTMETVTDFIFWGSKITADGNCSLKSKRRLLLGRKAMTNLDSIFKSRDATLPTKVHLTKAMVFPVIIYRCESWTIKKAELQRTDAFELWCWRKTFESSLDRKEIQPVHPKGNQS